MRLIDADAFDERVRIAVGFSEEDVSEDFKDGVSTTLLLLKTQQTVDAVQVVRCKECKRYDQINNSDGLCKKFIEFVNPSFFCADGEMSDYCPHCGAKMDG